MKEERAWILFAVGGGAMVGACAGDNIPGTIMGLGIFVAGVILLWRSLHESV